MTAPDAAAVEGEVNSSDEFDTEILSPERMTCEEWYSHKGWTQDDLSRMRFTLTRVSPDHMKGLVIKREATPVYEEEIMQSPGLGGGIYFLVVYAPSPVGGWKFAGRRNVIVSGNPIPFSGTAGRGAQPGQGQVGGSAVGSSGGQDSGGGRNGAADVVIAKADGEIRKIITERALGGAAEETREAIRMMERASEERAKTAEDLGKQRAALYEERAKTAEAELMTMRERIERMKENFEAAVGRERDNGYQAVMQAQQNAAELVRSEREAAQRERDNVQKSAAEERKRLEEHLSGLYAAERSSLVARHEREMASVERERDRLATRVDTLEREVKEANAKLLDSILQRAQATGPGGTGHAMEYIDQAMALAQRFGYKAPAGVVEDGAPAPDQPAWQTILVALADRVLAQRQEASQQQEAGAAQAAPPPASAPARPAAPRLTAVPPQSPPRSAAASEDVITAEDIAPALEAIGTAFAAGVSVPDAVAFSLDSGKVYRRVLDGLTRYPSATVVERLGLKGHLRGGLESPDGRAYVAEILDGVRARIRAAQ